jgi:hypothetical protein
MYPLNLNQIMLAEGGRMFRCDACIVSFFVQKGDIMPPRDALNPQRIQTSLVQCMANFAVMNIAANVVFAVQTSRAMVNASAKFGAFRSVSLGQR